MIRGIGIGVVISFAIAASVASSVFAQSTGGIGGRPANPDPNNPRTNSIFIYTLEKGEQKQDQVRVSNNSDEKQTIEIFAVDGIVTNTGAFTCKQNSEEKTGLSATIDLEKTEVTLAPGDHELVDFTVTMPKNADVGEHNACLAFQSKQDEGEVKGNIRLRTRQAIRLVATVPGDLNRSVVIDEFTVTNQDGKSAFTLDLTNTGNVSADVNTLVRMYSLFGGVAHKDGGQYPVLANEDLSLTFASAPQPFFGGWYTADASITYDKEAGAFGVSDDSTQVVTKTTDKKLIFIRPTTAGAITLGAILLVLLGALTYFLLQRRQRKHDLEHWHAHTVKAGESIETIAAAHHVSWKKLARRNNLKPPYALKEGAAIKVPPKTTKKSPKQT